MLWKCGMQNYERKGNCWRQLHQRTSSPYLHMVPDQSALITVADEQRGHLPKRGRARDSDAEKTYYAPVYNMVEDDNYGLDSDENGRYVELCLTAEMSEVVLSEQQHMILDADRVTTMR
eukprot:3350915-Pyramimonas_sp.AAC.1